MKGSIRVASRAVAYEKAARCVTPGAPRAAGAYTTGWDTT